MQSLGRDFAEKRKKECTKDTAPQCIRDSLHSMGPLMRWIDDWIVNDLPIFREPWPLSSIDVHGQWCVQEGVQSHGLPQCHMHMKWNVLSKREDVLR
jgi:hypothetical protein